MKNKIKIKKEVFFTPFRRKTQNFELTYLTFGENNYFKEGWFTKICTPGLTIQEPEVE